MFECLIDENDELMSIEEIILSEYSQNDNTGFEPGCIFDIPFDLPEEEY